MTEDLQVIELKEGDGPSWCSIFNTYSFFNLHKTINSYYFTLINTQSVECIGVCHFTEMADGVFKTPHRGTFGGFEMREYSIETIIFFVSQVEMLLQKKGAKQIIITTPPFHHNETYSVFLFNVLLNRGYSIENHEINYDIPVDDKDLVAKMNYNNVKRYRKCLREGFTFEQVFTEKEFNEVYDIIALNRKHKGITITMTFDQVLTSQKLFPDNYYFFKVSHNNINVASSICLKLDNTVFYVFYWGDLPEYNHYSPISYLAKGIYDFAQQNNFKLLDAGISTANGQTNIGLMKFKSNLGFTESLKLSYNKHL